MSMPATWPMATISSSVKSSRCMPSRRELRRQVARLTLVEIEAIDEGLEVGACVSAGIAATMAGRRGGSRGAQRLVEFRDHEGAGEFGDAARDEALGERELAQAQMRVDKAEREGEIVVGLRLDIRHLVAVPADGDGLVERQAGGRERPPRRSSVVTSRGNSAAQEPVNRAARARRRGCAWRSGSDHGRSRFEAISDSVSLRVSQCDVQWIRPCTPWASPVVIRSSTARHQRRDEEDAVHDRLPHGLAVALVRSRSGSSAAG